MGLRDPASVCFECLQDSLGFERTLEFCTANSKSLSEVGLRCERSGSLAAEDDNECGRKFRSVVVVRALELGSGWIFV